MLNKKTLTKLKVFVRRHLDKPTLQVSQKESSDIIYNVSESQPLELKDYVSNHRKPTFQQVLFRLIDQKGTSDATIYKKAWLDRRHFSKIRSNPDYRIGKNTVISLVLALELSQSKAEELLHAAGFTLSDSNTSDLVIQFCLKNKIYNLHDVNEALDYLSLKPLGNLD